jgi:hypothetical protein
VFTAISVIYRSHSITGQSKSAIRMEVKAQKDAISDKLQVIKQTGNLKRRQNGV